MKDKVKQSRPEGIPGQSSPGSGLGSGGSRVRVGVFDMPNFLLIQYLLNIDTLQNSLTDIDINIFSKNFLAITVLCLIFFAILIFFNIPLPVKYLVTIHCNTPPGDKLGL